jgi:CubicO group peptidase (beta-lactamase class C family)
MKSKLRLIFALLPLFLFVSADSQVTLEDRIKGYMSLYDCIGVSVVVVKDGSVCYSNCIGYNPDYKDSTARKPIKRGDIYWIASVSKTFVATAIMQLREKKKLSLDDDVNKYLDFKVQNPYFPETPITIKMLLSHRSSLNDHKYEYSFNQINPHTNPDYRLLYNKYQPGSDYHYCNLGYNILGAIIENVSGQRFDDYIKQNILSPLGLIGDFNVSRLDPAKLVWSYFYNKKTKSFEHDHTIYTYFEKEIDNYKLGYTTPVFSPAGGMKLSADALAQYMIMHMNEGKYNGKRIINRKSESLMRMIQTPETHYALSFRHYNNEAYIVIKDKELIGQTGGSHGIHSSMIFDPQKKYGFVVICNGCKSSYPDGADLNNKIINLCYRYLIND